MDLKFLDPVTNVPIKVCKDTDVNSFWLGFRKMLKENNLYIIKNTLIPVAFFIQSSTSQRVSLFFNSSDLQTVYFLPHPVTMWVFKSNSKHSDTVLTEIAEITVTILYTCSTTLTLLHSRKRCSYK
jgi:hypothetical protein